MPNLTSKILCSTAIITLLNMSSSPLYAGTEKDLSSQEEPKGIIINARSLEESSKSETKSSHLTNRRSKRAIGDPVGNEFVINQNTTGKHVKWLSSLASLTNGNVFVAWEGNQTGNADIYGRVFSPQGTAISNEFGINQVTTGAQNSPSVATLTNGNVFVTWNGVGISGRVFSPSGTAVSNEFSINQAAIGGQTPPSVAGLTNGDAFVVWWSGGTIIGRTFAPNGTAISNEFGINQNTTGTRNFPSVVSLTNGNAFITWNGAQTGDYDIYGRVFSPQGTAITNDFGINQDTTGDQELGSVGSLTNGNVFVAWFGDQIGNYNIYGRVFSPQGTAISSELSIYQNTTGSQAFPSVAGLTNGNVFVAWEGTQTGDDDIYGRVFSPQGTAISNEFSINQNTTGTQSISSVAGLTNGNVFVAWEGNQTGNLNIYGRIMSGEGLTNAPTSPTSPTFPTFPTSLTNAPTNSAERSTPLLLIPAKVVMDGGKILWNFATTKTWNSLDEIEAAERREKPKSSRTIQAPQKVFNYVKSWFSSESWNEYFDSMEKSVLDYSKSVVKETPSYQNAYFEKSTLKGITPLVSNVSYNSSIGTGFLPYSVVSGVIGK